MQTVPSTALLPFILVNAAFQNTACPVTDSLESHSCNLSVLIDFQTSSSHSAIFWTNARSEIQYLLRIPKHSSITKQVALTLAIMPTEKIANVEALKLGWDDNYNEVQGANVKRQMIWTGIIKEKPEPYIHVQVPRPDNDYLPPEPDTNEHFLIQIQPTRLKKPVWAMGGWTNHPDLSEKGTKVQFTLDPSGAFDDSESNTLERKDGKVVARSRKGTMASSVNFEKMMMSQGLSNGQGGGIFDGAPVDNSAWRPGMVFE